MASRRVCEVGPLEASRLGGDVLCPVWEGVQIKYQSPSSVQKYSDNPHTHNVHKESC